MTGTTRRKPSYRCSLPTQLLLIGLRPPLAKAPRKSTHPGIAHLAIAPHATATCRAAAANQLNPMTMGDPDNPSWMQHRNGTLAAANRLALSVPPATGGPSCFPSTMKPHQPAKAAESITPLLQTEAKAAMTGAHAQPGGLSPSRTIRSLKRHAMNTYGRTSPAATSHVQ